jgi:TonB family protein
MVAYFFKNFFCILLLWLAINSQVLAQDSTDQVNEVFSSVDEQAQPVEGLEKYYQWIGKNLRYPKSAVANNIEGKVFVKFVVERSGEITNAEVVKGFDPDCDQEAVRVISQSSKWIPAKKDGRTVRSAFTLPIAFKLTDDFKPYQSEKFEAALLESKYGALLVYNGEKNSFLLKFVSKSFKPTDKPNFVRMDGFIIQSSIVPFPKKFDFANAEEEFQKKFLDSWRMYERSWIEEQLKKQVKDQTKFIKIKERLFLHWITDMPEGFGDGSVAKQTYLVTACFDQLLVLNAPILKDQKEKDVSDKLQGIASTIELRPDEIQDLRRLYNELKK